MMTQSRREFVRMLGALGMTGATASLFEGFLTEPALGQTQTDYKALVCIFQNGGMDGANVIVPLSGGTGFGAADVTGGWPAYIAERQGPGLVTTVAPYSGTSLPPASGAEAIGQLRRVGAGAANPNLGMFGMNHYLGTVFSSVSPVVGVPGTNVTVNTGSLHALYQAGRAAVVTNVGTLIRPTSKSQYQTNPGGAHRPDQLFSHSDQIRQNQTCVFSSVAPTGVGGTGWGGRLADRTRPIFDGTRNFPPQVSISGAPQFMSGQTNFPLVIGTGALNTVLVLNGFGTAADEVARRTALTRLRDQAKNGSNVLTREAAKVLEDAQNVSGALSVDPQPLVTDPTNPARLLNLTFPNTGLGNQLRQVAKVIKANLQQPALAMRRQIFFCSIGGWDTHQNQVNNQPGLIQQVNQGMATLYYWLANNAPTTGEPTLGSLTSKVTAFTLSDFGRTFNPAGAGGIVGTDHGWGSHFLVMGGAVNGGRFYGRSVPGGNGTAFVTLGKGAGNAYDTGGRGTYIPGVSTLQYANTLAAWYGLPQDAATLDYNFPGLRTNFAGDNNLGFMA